MNRYLVSSILQRVVIILLLVVVHCNSTFSTATTAIPSWNIESTFHEQRKFSLTLSSAHCHLITKAAIKLYKQLIEILNQIETYQHYWQEQKFKTSSHKKIQTIVDQLHLEWNHIASYVASIYYPLNVIKSSPTEQPSTELYTRLLFLIHECLLHNPITNKTLSSEQALFILSEHNILKRTNDYTPSYYKKLKKYAAPPHLIRHWKKYALIGISCSICALYLYRHPTFYHNAYKLIQENFINPIKECWNMFFENPPEFPSFDTPPYLYTEEKEIYYKLIKDYLTLQEFYDQNPASPQKPQKGLLDKAIGVMPYISTIKERGNDINEVLQTIYTILHTPQDKIILSPEKEYEIDQRALHSANTAALGSKISADMASAYHNPLLHLIDVDRKIVGILPRLMGLKIQQINLLLAKITDDFSKASAYWNHKAVSMWKVLRVIGIFSIIPAAIISYKAYQLFTKQKCLKAPELRRILRSIDKTLLENYDTNEPLTLVQEGSILFWVQQLQHLAKTSIPDKHKYLFIEDVLALKRRDLSARERHELIKQIYQTFLFLRSV